MKDLIQKIGFSPKENTKEIFIKKYSNFDNYIIKIDFENKKIDYGNKIICESTTTQNFSQAENWVVLECVNRLLTKGYEPKNIILEKIYPTGHGTSERLDILIKKDNKAYLMIECKTYGKEFDKEFKNLEKNGGQLFTYFQQDTNAKNLILYTSRLNKNEIEYKNEIVKIEEDYKQAGNVKDLYERWNKLTKKNGIFDGWVNIYQFQSKAIIIENLKDIKQEDAQKIFNRFAEILRKHTVSDKPNAFNKIFNLFLCKICDEYTAKNDKQKTKFQWKDDDTNEIFQNRLNRLYREGMKLFLGKTITDFDEQDLKEKYPEIANNEKLEKYFMNILNEIRLKKNNEFAIKDVYDNQTFIENGKVLKECVELLQNYKIRYDKRHPYLSDFFELLLTTGLKQESGQFFTPVPIARYIIKSLPIKKIFDKKLINGNFNDLLPLAIDYAAGSGHFLHEFMHEIQNFIEKENGNNCSLDIKRKIESWGIAKFEWAKDYVYGIEKDYRLAKVTKVGCYLHGDGLAQIINGDGLDSFHLSDDFVGVLKKKEINNHDKKENPVFDIIIANPPYSVSNFKGNIKNAFKSIENKENSFELYDYLTDQSSEIECLFIERTKQLLKNGGVAGIILPTSILSNTGIYTKTREIILKYFDIIGITKFGSNTFMATGTNTVVLFLRKRNNYDYKSIQSSVDNFFINFQDNTVNGIENIFSKYISHVWKEININSYISLCQKSPNKIIQKHEIFIEYKQKLKAKNDDILYKQIIEKEKEKLLYFILAYKQKIILTKTGEKKAEKQFLGYEFSNRRGQEGIHPILKSKSIDECTKLFDSEDFYNLKKASTYVLEAFENKEKREIDENLQNNISRINLIDMISFDRVNFEKNIDLSVKKKIEIESKWELVRLGDIILEQVKSKIKVRTAQNTKDKIYNFFTSGEKILKFNDFLVDNENIYLSTGGNAIIKYFKGKASYSTDTFVINSKNEKIIKTKLLFYFLENKIDDINNFYFKGLGLKHLQKPDFRNLKIPLPPKNIQEKIVKKIEEIEEKENKNKKRVKELKKKINELFEIIVSKSDTFYRLSDNDIFDISIGKRVLAKDFSSIGKIPVYSANVFKPFGYIDKLLIQDFSVPSVLWGIDGDWMVNYLPKNISFYPTDHCGILRIKNKKINEKYLAYVLQKEGEKLEFSRNKRASINRIQSIKIKAPSISEQQKIVTKIEKIEKEIKTLQPKIDNSKKQKEEILKKYL